MSGGVTVGKLLQSRPETLGLDIEILAGSGGLAVSGGAFGGLTLGADPIAYAIAYASALAAAPRG